MQTFISIGKVLTPILIIKQLKRVYHKWIYTKGSSKNYISGSKIITLEEKLEVKEEIQSKEIT